MGYDLTRFIDKVDEEYLCKICLMVLENPVQTPCDHLFCNECIKEWLTLNDVCPEDRQSVKISDVKPCRIIRNVLAKLTINCDFQQQGCKSVIALEHLQNHLTSCEYNPTSKIICDKGCNFSMNKYEYEANNCFMHLSNRVAGQDKKIKQLSHELTNQKEEFQRKFNRQIADNQRALNHQKDENVKMKDEVRSLQEQIGRLMSTPKQIMIKKRPLKWQRVDGINISTDELNILDGDSVPGFAQLCYPLDSSSSYFEVEILAKNSNKSICIGLTQASPEPICYDGDGKLNGVIFKNQDVPVLAVGDIIECGIDYTYNFNIDATYNVKLYFHKNGEFILKELVQMPPGGFYPSVWLHRGDKIKFSTN